VEAKGQGPSRIIIKAVPRNIRWERLWQSLFASPTGSLSSESHLIVEKQETLRPKGWKAEQDDDSLQD